MARSYDISKQDVWQAYQLVKANKGAAGIDGQTIEDFEQDLKRNLYKIWNRLTSGSYLPPAVMAVRIPKRSGGTRVLGIPTLSDRIVQMVVKMHLEPILEPCFHEDSYGSVSGWGLTPVDSTAHRHPAATIGLASGTVSEREEFAQTTLGVQAFAKALLGSASIGTGLLGGEQWECDG